MARTAAQTLDALYAAGVDNWDGYYDAIRDVDDVDDAEEVLSALRAAGVDNWEGYCGAL